MWRVGTDVFNQCVSSAPRRLSAQGPGGEALANKVDLEASTGIGEGTNEVNDEDKPPDMAQVTVFNREPHSGSGASEVSFWKRHFRTASEFPAPFRTQKGQRYFGNDRNRFRKVLVPFRTRNRRKHSNCLTISYVHLNL